MGLLRFPVTVAGVAVGVWTVLRLALWIRFAPAGVPAGEAVRLAGQGLVQDVVYGLLGVCVLVGISGLVATLLGVTVLPLRIFGLRAWGPAWGWLFRLAVGGGCMVAVFLVISEWYFFVEFESRFNTVAIDYLIYPHEVFTNLRESYPLGWIAVACAVGGAGLAWWLFRPAHTRPWREAGRAHRWAVMTGWSFLAGSLALWAQRADRPASPQRVLSELAANGWGSVLKAAWSRNLSYPAFYPVMDRAVAFRRVRELLAEPGVEFPHPPAPDLPGGVAPKAAPDAGVANAEEEAWLDRARDSLKRRVAGDPGKPRLNVCIVVEESLGSEFWGSLGRMDDGHPDSLTPRMDEVARRHGGLFTHLLADGNRTIRGLEAIFSSFPPLPGDAILARDRTEAVETIARVLKRDGYQTLFLYAGRGGFDFIRSYSLRNGWDRLVEESDFVNPAFRTAWGVSDEDLLQRGIEEMRALKATGRPFLTSFMTVSNHRPYTYPKGRIPEDPDQHRRSNAVRYADWALGDFFERAEKEPFWKDTIFVVVADHGARVYGSQTIPLPSYRIPCVIVAPGLMKPGSRLDVSGSQLDLAPTILGLIGRPYESLFFGHNLLAEGAGARTRCLMHHNRSIAAYHDGRQVVFGLNRTVEYWAGDPFGAGMRLVMEPDAAFRELEADGTALYQVADALYMGRRYHLGEAPGAGGQGVEGRSRLGGSR